MDRLKAINIMLGHIPHITCDSGCLVYYDRLDVLEMGVAQLVESMSLDVDEQVRIREEEELSALIEEYEQYHQILTFPVNPDEGTWLNI